jgi:DNA-binding protein HU-beta
MANKAQLIEALSERIGDKKAAAEAVDGLVDIIIRTVHKGEKVTITGFGVFEKRARAARTARNPRTGESVRVKKTNVPAFRAGTTFKDVISGSKKLPKATAVKRATATRATATSTTRAAAAKPATTRTRATATKAPAAKATTAKAATAKATATKATTTRATKAAPAKAAATKATAVKATATKAKATTTRATKAAAKPAAKKTTAAAKKAPFHQKQASPTPGRGLFSSAPRLPRGPGKSWSWACDQQRLPFRIREGAPDGLRACEGALHRRGRQARSHATAAKPPSAATKASVTKPPAATGIRRRTPRSAVSLPAGPIRPPPFCRNSHKTLH